MTSSKCARHDAFIKNTNMDNMASAKCTRYDDAVHQGKVGVLALTISKIVFRPGMSTSSGPVTGSRAWNWISIQSYKIDENLAPDLDGTPRYRVRLSSYEGTAISILITSDCVPRLKRDIFRRMNPVGTALTVDESDNKKDTKSRLRHRSRRNSPSKSAASSAPLRRRQSTGGLPAKLLNKKENEVTAIQSAMIEKFQSREVVRRGSRVSQTKSPSAKNIARRLSTRGLSSRLLGFNGAPDAGPVRHRSVKDLTNLLVPSATTGLIRSNTGNGKSSSTTGTSRRNYLASNHGVRNNPAS